AIAADGGLVVLSAAARDEIFDRVINHTGIIEADSLVEKEGRIVLSGGATGVVRVDGGLTADGRDGVDAGAIEVKGRDVELGDKAWLSAKGKGKNSDGGEIRVLADRNGFVDGQAVIDVSGGYVSGNGGAAEISAKENLVVDGVTVNAGAVEGAAGTALFDPADLTISSNVFSNGGNLSYQADNSITVLANVIISTRICAAGADHETAASTGNSGSIAMDAPLITIDSGAKLLAQGTDGFQGGDVTLTADKEALTVTPFVNYNEADAKITINDAVIKGDDISITATADAGRTFSDGDDPLEWAIGLLNVGGGPASTFGGGIAVANSDARVEVNS
ncbi:MAG TPA: hypothetical protein VFI22_01680, partial [Thermomicrobiales bacterium]|nr:hypothetical protein [Thermomicrobiales bacterium]